MTEALEIDPFNSNRMMYGTGATIYGTENLTNWDSGSKFTIKPMVAGPGGDGGQRPRSARRPAAPAAQRAR